MYIGLKMFRKFQIIVKLYLEVLWPNKKVARNTNPRKEKKLL